MNWWQIVATCLAGTWVTWKALVEQIIHPPWVIKVSGCDTSRFGSTVYRAGNAVDVVIERRFRDGDYTKNKVRIGTLALDDEDFDEKLLDLRDRAKDRAKRLNKLEGVVKK